MIYYFILALIIGITLLTHLPFYKKQSLRIKIIIPIFICIISFLIFLIILVLAWNSGESPRENIRIHEHEYKHIYFINNTKKKLYLILNFKYSEEEIKKHKLNIDNYYNRKDTVLLSSNKYSNDTGVILPISVTDSIKFPLNFKIEVIDSLHNSFETYDEVLFFRKSISEPKIIKNKYQASSWTLKIE